MVGGDGEETVVFAPNFGRDVIIDFQAGTGPGDVLAFDDTIFARFRRGAGPRRPGGHEHGHHGGCRELYRAETGEPRQPHSGRLPLCLSKAGARQQDATPAGLSVEQLTISTWSFPSRPKWVGLTIPHPPRPSQRARARVCADYAGGRGGALGGRAEVWISVQARVVGVRFAPKAVAGLRLAVLDQIRMPPGPCAQHELCARPSPDMIEKAPSMRILLVAAALSMTCSASFAACVCACVNGRATEVCSKEPGSLNLPIICQRLCIEPVTTPLTSGGDSGAMLGARQESGAETRSDPSVNILAPK